jgi:hypothetical protein
MTDSFRGEVWNQKRQPSDHPLQGWLVCLGLVWQALGRGAFLKCACGSQMSTIVCFTIKQISRNPIVCLALIRHVRIVGAATPEELLERP